MPVVRAHLDARLIRDLRELHQLRDLLQLATSREEVDEIIERHEQLFRWLRPGARLALCEIVGKRLALLSPDD